MAKSAAEGNAGKGTKYEVVHSFKDSAGNTNFVGETNVGSHGLYTVRSPENDHNKNVNSSFAFTKANKK